MGRLTNLRDLIGILKDKASLSKHALLSKPLHLAVLRATSHSSSNPPHHHRLASLLSLGDASRATASILVHSLMDRLHRTHDSSVALKCLFTIHHIINRGPFILKDQLSVYPSTGGRNHLKLSDFRDGASPTTWVLSAWVRWYALYLETILSTSKRLGFVLSSYSCSLEREKQEDSISSFLNSDLIRDFSSLVGVIEEICKVPDNLLVERHKLLHGIMELLASDYLSAVNEILLRLSEFKERLNLLSFNDSVDLSCALDRLVNCKEKSLQLFTIRKPSIEILWEMIKELNNKIGMVNLRKIGRSDCGNESARFGHRVVKPSDSMKFSSGRLVLKGHSLMILEGSNA